MAYVPGEEGVKSFREDRPLISAVYKDLMAIGGYWGSTRFNSHGYVAGFVRTPDISVLQVKYPDIEFRHFPKPKDEVGQFHDEDEFNDADDIVVAFRTKGSKGWHLG